MSKEIKFTVPLVPPNLNHYKIPVWQQRRFVVTKEAQAFKDAIAILICGEHVIADAFEVEAIVFLAESEKGDVDGFGKLILDGLAEAGAFRRNRPVNRRANITQYLSDAYVTDFIMRKRRDKENPRTEITVRAING